MSGAEPLSGAEKESAGKNRGSAKGRDNKREMFSYPDHHDSAEREVLGDLSQRQMPPKKRALVHSLGTNKWLGLLHELIAKSVFLRRVRGRSRTSPVVSSHAELTNCQGGWP